MQARAFTLLEIIAVVVILGLLLAFSPLVLNSLVSRKELEAEVTRLGSMIETLRIQSVLDQATFAIHYDTDDHRWAIQVPIEITEEPNSEDAEPTKRLKLEDEVGPEELDWHQLPKGISLQFYEGRTRHRGRYRVLFDPQGTVPPHTLVLESDNISSLDEEERTRTLKVNFPGFVSYAPGRVIDDFKKTEAELGR